VNPFKGPDDLKQGGPDSFKELFRDLHFFELPVACGDSIPTSNELAQEEQTTRQCLAIRAFPLGSLLYMLQRVTDVANVPKSLKECHACSRCGRWNAGAQR
jgi:hypothetical protein